MKRREGQAEGEDPGAQGGRGCPLPGAGGGPGAGGTVGTCREPPAKETGTGTGGDTGRRTAVLSKRDPPSPLPPRKIFFFFFAIKMGVLGRKRRLSFAGKT